MSDTNMKLVLSLTGRDDGAVKLLRETERQLLKSKLSREQLARSNRPYELAGIRSERAIQREILQTQAAFRRLARSGTASQNDLQRAAVATKNRIRELTAELNQGIGAQSRWGKGLQTAGRIGAGTVAGSMAAYSVLKPAMDNEKQLDANMAQVAWQAYGEDGSKSADWIAKEGKSEIRALVKELVDRNGGTADAALTLINSMMANGMDFGQVRGNANASHRAMLASSERPGEYNPEDTAKLMKVLGDFGFKDENLAKAFEYAMKSGMQGNFEIADMVRELPALLPAAKAAGMDGLDGFAMLLSTLQSAANKAGSNSEAANNVRNLLEKTLSADTVKRLEKMANPNAPGKGIDWQASVLKGRENGESAVQVLSRLANTILEKDRKYQEYKKRADTGDTEAQSQMNIMKGFVLSKLLPDLQAKAGLLAASDIEQVQGLYQELIGMKDSDSLVDKRLAVQQSTALAQQERAESLAMLERDAVTAPLVEAETALKSLTAEYPNATLALQALAAAATAAAVAQGAVALLGRGGGAAGGLRAGLGTAAGSAGKWLGRAAPLAVVGAGVFDAVNIERRNDLSRREKNTAQVKNAGETGGGLAGALAGGKLGAVIGTAIAPGIGTAVGAALGSIGGGLAGAFAGGRLADLISSAGAAARANIPEAAKPLPLQPAAPPASLKTAETPEKLTPVITEQTAAYQTAISTQTAQYQAAVADDTAAVTSSLSAITALLSGLNQTIQNNMTVNLDGRVIANEVSRYQVAMFGRGAAQ
ncbi:phage tail tape measure protein [Neisseria leonii]|uniref:phage tail tape measure protein n=1 Tax=Neisseria leonii TaxID=2995413 RepID=UPI00237C28F0|nr:phage tail tape measure protein [Neisseria sp. 3986]MDD9325610.1 phage tail tape measure protein [Neisseria sp. 3986]